MKALSLKQPFAELVVSGKKTIEIRKWNTKFRGEFYIHASKTPYEKTDLPCGYIVGKATLKVIKHCDPFVFGPELAIDNILRL